MSGQVRFRPPGLGANPSFYIVPEIANVFTSVSINISPSPVLLIVFERSRISVTSEFCFRPPSFRPLTRFQTVPEITDVCGAVGIAVSAMPLHFIAFKCPDVAVTRQFCFRTPDSDTLPRLRSINKSTTIFTTISITIDALATRDPGFVLPDVFGSVGKTVCALSVERIIKKRSNVFIPVGKGISAQTLETIIFEQSIVFISIGEGEYASSVEETIFKLADILVSVCKCESPLTIKNIGRISALISVSI